MSIEGLTSIQQILKNYSWNKWTKKKNEWMSEWVKIFNEFLLADHFAFQCPYQMNFMHILFIFITYSKNISRKICSWLASVRTWMLENTTTPSKTSENIISSFLFYSAKESIEPLLGATHHGPWKCITLAYSRNSINVCWMYEQIGTNIH